MGVSGIIANPTDRGDCGQSWSTTCPNEGFHHRRKVHYYSNFHPVLPTCFVLWLERVFPWV